MTEGHPRGEREGEPGNAEADEGWGEWPEPDDDERLMEDRPPHWSQG